MFSVFIPDKFCTLFCNSSCDCIKTFFLKIHAPNQLIFRTSNKLTISNEYLFVIPSFNSCIITFNIIISTSLPGTCIIFPDNLLRKRGILTTISTVPTNDTYLYISLFNNTDRAITVKKNSIQFECIIVAGNFYYR